MNNYLRLTRQYLIWQLVLLGVLSGLINWSYAEVPIVTFSVSEFVIEGENPISAELVNSTLEPFMGEHEGLEGLLAAAAELESAILNAGHSFHRVILPQQTLKDGIVKLEIVQITLGQIHVEGNEHFTTENIINTLPGLVPGTVPDTRQLSRQLIVANNHPSKSVTIRMKQSEQPDSVDAVLDVQDQRPWQLFSILNNIGTSVTGRMRLSVGGQHNNLLGFDDSLTASYTTSPGHTSDVKQWGLNYRIPVYKYSGSFNFFYSRSDVDSGTVQDVFDVSGAGKFIGGSYTHTFLNRNNYRHRLSFGVEDKFFVDSVSFLGVPIGVDVRSRPLVLIYSGEYQMEKSSLVFNAAYVRNLNGGNKNTKATYAAARTSAEQDWDVVRYGITYNSVLPKNIIMTLAWTGQHSNEPLISGEQFGIGGVNSIRGFEERAVSGDRGNQATLEFSRLVYNNKIQLRAFSDMGHVKIKSPVAGQIVSETLISAGGGLSWYINKHLNFSVDYAHELNPAKATDTGGTKTHASLFYRF